MIADCPQEVAIMRKPYKYFTKRRLSSANSSCILQRRSRCLQPTVLGRLLRAHKSRSIYPITSAIIQVDGWYRCHVVLLKNVAYAELEIPNQVFTRLPEANMDLC